jgi:hypothetical protein
VALDERPTVTAGVLGAALGQLAPRLRRRLDSEPAIASLWVWDQTTDHVTIQSDDALVTLVPESGTISLLSAATCSCLLAPACVHIAAVLSSLEVVATVGEGPDPEDSSTTPAGPATTIDTAPSDQMRDAVLGLSEAVARILEVGAMAAGVVARGEILRAVHTCQVVGLHRAASAGLRVAEGLARLQAGDPEFRLVELRKDVAEALRVARWITRGNARIEVIGIARRAYEPVGALRLYGVFTEPIIARSGYAGVVTYFVDRDQCIWALSDVLPADAERAVDAYANGAALGDVALSHRAASRAGLHIGDARASRDGRLGRGQQVRAVGAAGAKWSEPPIDDLFRVPLTDQLARIWRAFEVAEADRRQGESLLFATATVVGPRAGQLVVEIDGIGFTCVAPGDHPELAYRDNLTVLGDASGTRLRLAGRPLPDRAGTMELLAIGEEEGGGLSLPRSWATRANLGLDRLARANAAPHEPAPPIAQRHVLPDVLEPLTRRLDRMVVGGRATMGDTSRRGVGQDIVLFRRRHLPTAAISLADLAVVATTRNDASALADSWLAAVTYERAAHRRISGNRWLVG